MSDNHVFERTSRVPADAVAALLVDAWEPPTIDEKGHLVQARPRDNDAAHRKDFEPGIDGIGNESAAQGQQDSESLGFAEGKALGVEAGHIEGLESGHKEGFDLGMAEAAEDIHKQEESVSLKLTELNKLLSCLSNALNEQDYQLEQALLNTALAIANSVVRYEMATQPGQIMSVVKQAIAALPPSRDNIKIYCNPADKDLISESSAFGGENWTLLVDEELEAGGCKVLTDQSVVDYSLSTRFQSAVDSLLGNQGAVIAAQDPAFVQAPEPALGASSQAAEQAVETDAADKAGAGDEQ